MMPVLRGRAVAAWGNARPQKLLCYQGFGPSKLGPAHISWPAALLQVQPSRTCRREICTTSRAVMALERPATVTLPSAGLRHSAAEHTIAYEVIQGALVRWSARGRSSRPPPTAIMVHGILGSRKNMLQFAQRLVEGHPSWQVLLVDMRCHGESAQLAQQPRGPHGVDTAAGDILRLLAQLKLFPEVLIGHSFGGKVVMSMAEQFGRIGMQMPRPVQVWVLDALPGANWVVSAGFSLHIARWTSTNLRPFNADHRRLTWSFDLAGIHEMYVSYETTSLWPFLQNPPNGVRVNFVKAADSNFRWAGHDEDRLRALGHNVHLLSNAGHWVHTDNPEGLFDILSPSFGMVPDLHMLRASQIPERARTG
ncbi:hypothetical protein WJX72_005084 [[Myrmecia] bisecta]|uniref:AB hydrolase-1 domain-containing protein n=1 Tax=[Myrmecia] bisecta TaxID=41462 RepID=A0AAW1PH76_9CHLO